MRQPLHARAMYPAGVHGVSSRMQTLPDGVRLRVLEAGAPHGAPIVFLHGWGASAFMWRHALALLPDRGFRVIAIDLRGFGLSDKPSAAGSYSLNSYCLDLDGLFDALELTRASLVGQSMGGGLALHYALSRSARVDRLVLINPACLVPIGALALARAVPGVIAEAFGKLVTPGMVALTLKRVAYGDASLVTQREVDEYWSPTRLPGYAHAAHATLVEFDWRPIAADAAARLNPPALVVLGDDDRLIHNTAESAHRLRSARVEVVPGGHCVHEQHPDLVYRLIGDFLR